MSGNGKLKIVVNAPVVLGFSAICCIALLVNFFTHDASNMLLFSVHRSSLASILTYFRFVGHIFGHANMEHLVSNLTMILVLGPMLEEKYGSKDLLFVIFVTAIVTGLVHFIFFPTSSLLGASGVVFAFILLSSMTGFKSREIPLTFIIVAIVYLGGQIYEGLSNHDNVSQLTHIVGGLVGSILGYIGAKK